MTKTRLNGGKTHRRVSGVDVMIQVMRNIRTAAAADETVNDVVDEKPGCSCQGPGRTLLFGVKTAESNTSHPIQTLK